MGAVLSPLVERWLAGSTALPILDEASVAVARDAARIAAAAAGLDTLARERLAAVASELGHNQRRHAGGGMIALRETRRDGVAGVEIVAADAGRGIADPTRAFTGAPTVGATGGAGGLGVGLSAVLRQADEVDVDVRHGEGTCVWARIFAAAVPRSEIAIVGRAGPSDPVSGDDALVLRDAGGVLAGVVDGLGHGPAAREAAERALAILTDHRASTLPELIERCDAQLAGSRGAVLAVGRLDHPRAVLEHASMGNVTSRLVGADGATRPLLAQSGTLGVGQIRRRVQVETVAFEPPQLLLVVTDGITSRVDLSADLVLLRQHPILIAHAVMNRFARGTDDALVLVAR